MNTEEYANLNHIEREHWYYAGKREIVRHWLNYFRPVGASSILLDCGAGTGAFAMEMSAGNKECKKSGCSVLALDDHNESLDILREKLGADKVVRGDCTHIPLADASCDYLTALDVIEHIPDDAGAIREFVRVLKPGGLAVITVPALQCLWSDWDVSLHHQRRYNRSQLTKLLQAAGLKIVHINYVNVAAFPAVWFIRKRRSHGKQSSPYRMEDSLPPRLMNSILKKLFVIPACQKLVSFPFGVGLLAVAKKI